MTGTLALAGAEIRLLVRDRPTLASATVIPLAMAVLLMQNKDIYPAQATGPLAATQLMLMLSFSTYAAATMALAGRRADLYLKRLRNSPLSATGIVAGLTLPLFAVTVAQIAVVLTMVSVTLDTPPVRPELLVLAVLIGGVLSVALAFLTAAYTRSPQAAQMTAMPPLSVLAVGTFWTLARPVDEVSVLPLLVPGGGIAQLARLGWDGVPGGELTELLSLAGIAAGASLVTTAVACLVAARLFTWEPRN